MDSRNRLTDDEWDALAAGPVVAAAAMLATSRPGFVGALKESLAGGRATTEIPTDAEAHDLIEALAEHVREHEEVTRAFLETGDEDDREFKRTAGLDGVDRAGLAARKLSPGEAEGYTGWVLGVARAMAEAAPDSGEREPVSADEEHTIVEIERRLRHG